MGYSNLTVIYFFTKVNTFVLLRHGGCDKVDLLHWWQLHSTVWGQGLDYLQVHPCPSSPHWSSCPTAVCRPHRCDCAMSMHFTLWTIHLPIISAIYVEQSSVLTKKLEMWANAQRDGRPAEYRWRPLSNATKFGWRPLLECHAVTLSRRKTRWNLQGCPKLVNRSQLLVGRSSPYCEDMWRRYCCLTSFFQLLIRALVAKI